MPSTNMRPHPLTTITIMPPSSRKPPSTSTPSSSKPQSPNCPSLCHQSPSATLDLLIFILVLFSGAFLIASYLSYLFQSLTLILPPFSSSISKIAFFASAADPHSKIAFFALSALSLLLLAAAVEICCGRRSRRCGRAGCRGLKKGVEFDLQLQGEEVLRTDKVREVDGLPWKGGSEDNPDYECLRAELRKMAPVNGRAVLLFCLKCGCPVSKLEGWAPRRGRRSKRGLALTGGGDNNR